MYKRIQWLYIDNLSSRNLYTAQWDSWLHITIYPAYQNVAQKHMGKELHMSAKQKSHQPVADKGWTLIKFRAAVCPQMKDH